MSFGGAVSAMITSLKNNKRSRTSTFSKLEGYQKVKYKEGKIEKTATPEQLKEIRERIQRENRKNTVISVVFIVLCIAILYILLKFATF